MLGVQSAQSPPAEATPLCASLSHPLDASPVSPSSPMTVVDTASSRAQASITTAGSGTRRKSIPARSISRDDGNPGLVFRIDGGVQVVCLPDGNPRLLLATSPAGRDWGWRISGSTSNGGGILLPKRGSESMRPRSNSMTQAERLTCPQEERQRHLDSDMEESNSDCNSGHPAAIAIPKRRASVSTGPFVSAAQPNPNAHITVYSASLAHLVPNAFLQTTSRRISTHGAAPGCICTSCSSTVTPYWRDGWAVDVMLCNACGLRFQKFARRCPSCLYIPRKEDSLGNRCIKCSTPWIVGPSSNSPHYTHCSYTSFSQ